MKKSALLIILLCGVVVVQAQSRMVRKITGDYQHTVSVDGNKETFFTTDKAVVPAFSDAAYYSYANNRLFITQGGYSGKPLHGAYEAFFANRNLKTAGFFDHGLKTGMWKNWREDGSLQLRETWAGGKRNGFYERLDSAGQVVETGHFRNNLLHGRVKKYISKDSIQVLTYKGGVFVQPETRSGGLFRRLFSPNDSLRTRQPAPKRGPKPRPAEKTKS